MDQPRQSASNDAEEAANIALASEEEQQEHRQQQAGAANNNNNQQSSPQPPNGHLEPNQRRLYLALFAFAALCALNGLILIFVWMFNYRAKPGIGLTDSGQLANLHPILMYIFMVSLNMYAVLIYRTHYWLPKEKLKWIHAILSGGNIVMSLLGVFAMFKSHLISGQPNFYSLHSWIGTLTNTFYLSQFVIGFIAFLNPGLAQHKRAALMPWHRFAGSAILILAALACITGITELVIFQDDKDAKLYSKFTPITFIANMAGISVVLMTATTVYLLSAQQYLRPRLPEEEPLKR